MESLEDRTTDPDDDADSRAAAARRPAWIDAGIAAASGATVALGTSGRLALGFLILVVGTVVVAVLLHRIMPRPPRVLDGRAVAANMGALLLFNALLFVLGQLEPRASWLPWFPLGAGLLAGVGGYAYLRWENRYQVRRLAAGDHNRYDLM